MNLEAYAYERGRDEAAAESQRDNEAYSNGRAIGLQRGYALALELSFYANHVQMLLDSMFIPLLEQQHPAGEQQQQQSKDRLRKRCAQLLESYANLPDNNDADYEFDALVNVMRTLYKLIGKEAVMPAFKPLLKEAQLQTHDW